MIYNWYNGNFLNSLGNKVMSKYIASLDHLEIIGKTFELRENLKYNLLAYQHLSEKFDKIVKIIILNDNPQPSLRFIRIDNRFRD